MNNGKKLAKAATGVTILLMISNEAIRLFSVIGIAGLTYIAAGFLLGLRELRLIWHVVSDSHILNRILVFRKKTVEG